QLDRFHHAREAKLHTRCGMGPCQGRVCGAATRFLYGWKTDSVRPPIFPVRTDALAGLDGASRLDTLTASSSQPPAP
ncbi:MAG: hypothetical protein ACYC23_11935, partial [Limisphaerales bacterium]